eukprot:5510064-Prymnesium_polylepis.1
MAKGGPRLARRTRRAAPRGWEAVRNPPVARRNLRTSRMNVCVRRDRAHTHAGHKGLAFELRHGMRVLRA